MTRTEESAKIYNEPISRFFSLWVERRSKQSKEKNNMSWHRRSTVYKIRLEFIQLVRLVNGYIIRWQNRWQLSLVCRHFFSFNSILYSKLSTWIFFRTILSIFTFGSKIIGPIETWQNCFIFLCCSWVALVFHITCERLVLLLMSFLKRRNRQNRKCILRPTNQAFSNIIIELLDIVNAIKSNLE